MKKINEPAALHLGSAAFDEIDVPVGIHDLSRGQILIRLPQGAAVERSPGTEGNGYDLCEPSPKLALEAALLFIERSGLVGPTTYPLWRQCIKEVMETKAKADKLIQPEAAQALKEVSAEVQGGCKHFRKTPAKRLGVSGIEVCVTRLTIASVIDTSRMLRRTPRGHN